MKSSTKARSLRSNLTYSENKLWSHIRKRQINKLKFRRQHPIGNFIVDFVCLEKKIVIEIDGGQHNENADYDLQRTKWLENEGYKILRFWNNEVLENTDSVLEVIYNETRKTPPS